MPAVMYLRGGGKLPIFVGLYDLTGRHGSRPMRSSRSIRAQRRPNRAFLPERESIPFLLSP